MSWTEDQNQRRCALIDKEIDATLSDDEEIQLSQLQSEMLDCRRKIAPLPIEEARRVFQELLTQESKNAD